MSSRPLVSMLGTKKSIWVNFEEICAEKQISALDMIKHVEHSLGVVCHHHETQLVIPGRFTSAQIAKILTTI